MGREKSALLYISVGSIEVIHTGSERNNTSASDFSDAFLPLNAAEELWQKLGKHFVSVEADLHGSLHRHVAHCVLESEDPHL